MGLSWSVCNWSSGRSHRRVTQENGGAYIHRLRISVRNDCSSLEGFFSGRSKFGTSVLEEEDMVRMAVRVMDLVAGREVLRRVVKDIK